MANGIHEDPLLVHMLNAMEFIETPAQKWLGSEEVTEYIRKANERKARESNVVAFVARGL